MQGRCFCYSRLVYTCLMFVRRSRMRPIDRPPESRALLWDREENTTILIKSGSHHGPSGSIMRWSAFLLSSSLLYGCYGQGCMQYKHKYCCSVHKLANISHGDVPSQNLRSVSIKYYKGKARDKVSATNTGTCRRWCLRVNRSCKI